MPEPLDTCREWVELVIPALAGQVLNGPIDRGPRLTGDYAVLQIRTSAPIHVPVLQTTAISASTIGGDPNKVVQRRVVLREGTLRIDLFGPNAVSYAEELQLGPLDFDGWEKLRGDVTGAPGERRFYVDAIALNSLGPVIDLSGVRDTKRETRAQVDFRVRWRTEKSEEMDWIETVTGSFMEA